MFNLAYTKRILVHYFRLGSQGSYDFDWQNMSEIEGAVEHIENAFREIEKRLTKIEEQLEH